MTTSRFDLQYLKHRFWGISRMPAATLVVLGAVAFAGAIAGAWFAREGTVSGIFATIDTWQKNPPVWLQVPDASKMYLLLPTVVLVSVALAAMKISPQPQKRSRAVVVAIVLALTIRYVLWRSLATLNLSDPLNGIFSLGLFFLEMLMVFTSSIQLYLMIGVKDRCREADRMAVAVTEGKFAPTVDILIPTYNEPIFILRRTVIGCQALDYPHKKVYLLDDTKRPEIKLLAKKMGCEYITRPDNLHAKAGNINHATALTDGELIVVFDADFIPTKNFLTRTVGFFQNPEIALVQTPQSFYNHDPIARNLGLENVLAPEEEVFYRQIEIIKDSADSVICCGTSFVVRRSALQAVGGFVTDSVCEDYFTGIRLSATGYRLVYLDEKLSAGLAAENIEAHLTQRVRWARGTLQAFFINSNPLTIRGLRFVQRLSHLEGLLHWFTSLTRVLFLLMPLAYSFLGIIPLRTNARELLYFFLPYYLVQVTVFSWLNRRSRSALLSDVYSFVQCIPLAVTVMSAMLNPFDKGFKVTPKGIASDRFNFNWNLGWPLIVLFAATAFSLWHNLNINLVRNWSSVQTVSETADLLKGVSLGWIWSVYNLLMLGIALLILVDIPKPDIYEWFNLRRVVQLNVGGETLWGITTVISESGAEVALTKRPSFAVKGKEGNESFAAAEMLPNYAVQTSLSQGKIRAIAPTAVKARNWLAPPVLKLDTEASLRAFLIDCESATLEIMEEKCFIPVAKIELVGDRSQLKSSFRDAAGCTVAEFPTVRIAFDRLSVSQRRCLIEMLYCRPGQWQRQETPGEWRSLWLLLRIALKPRAVFERNRSVRAIGVSQV
ncbi:glycosyltransferase [Tychonema sp. LEGE 07199]|uniref:glycosyltransferase family 2 protein n=1 Tax=unclassified Tychonema TaxID=2642144 RepID=UPI00187F9038|nr:MULTISPECIES: cellulose synthase catalytic subunit [unclassified Tychonema]MBE9121790.1 glycosyltransferase [Tychonema sp. LEGE 07199]MBE9134078.1 glycosyltransferase [Tychonema sp. LEGE 07196]